MQVAVIALGKIGLPLAVQFASLGHDVVGCDINQTTVDQINQGIAPFGGEAGLEDGLSQAVTAGRLRATSDFSVAVPGRDVVVVVVPLVVDQEGLPDFAGLDSAAAEIGRNLSPNTLVVFETTLPVGTTRNRLAPILERESGLQIGTDLFVAFSPERVFSSRIFADLRRYPKLVGGLEAQSAKRAIQFYESALEFDVRPDLARPNGVWDLGSAEAAEMAKLAETTYRDVNIGLANQFARFADSCGIDIYGVIEAANSQPFSHIHQPGIAVGGHCIPVYPRFYLWNDPNATIVAAAREANLNMPAYAVGVLEGALGDLNGLRVAVLGIAYRGGVKESAFSGVFATAAELVARGAQVAVHDPLYNNDEITEFGFAPYQLGEQVDAAIVQTDHAEYRQLQETDFPGIKALVDGRRITEAGNFSGIIRRELGNAAR